MQVGNRSQFSKVIFASSTEESLRKNTANTFCSSDAGKEAKVCRNWGLTGYIFWKASRARLRLPVLSPWDLLVHVCESRSVGRVRKHKDRSKHLQSGFCAFG